MNPLGVVKNIVEAVGMDISYAYEDLIFLEHNGFLLQFSDNDREILIHTNQEAEATVVDQDISRLMDAARQYDMRFSKGSLYSLTQEDDETIRIEFDEAP